MSERCKHEELRWDLSINEDGWVCVDPCGKKLGFRPDRDRSDVAVKIECLLLYLDESKIFSVSNSTEGEMIVRAVAERCVAENAYDQTSLIRFILEGDGESHADYWRKKAHEELTNVRKVVRRLREREGVPLLFTVAEPKEEEIDLTLLRAKASYDV